MTARVRILKKRTHQAPSLSILDAVADDNLFGRWFRDRATWQAWFAFLATIFALPMSDEQLELFRECTGRNEPPSEPIEEAWLVVGRRGGKSFIMALIAVFVACFREYRPYLSPGERATVLLIARDRKQARVLVRYIRALLTLVPMLSRMVDREWAEGFDLSNSVTIEVATASFRATRGYAICCAICDEIAFWSVEDSAEPDHEILAALRPGMAQFPNALLLCASSPYARRGELYRAHKSHFGKDGDPILAWQAGSRRMNPTIKQKLIDDALERDPASAAAEFLAQFRSDIEAFLSREAVEACVLDGVLERPYMRKTFYRAHVDPSGGSSDSFTLAIAHKEGTKAVLDLMRERKPPFSPEQVVEEFSAILKSYGIRRVTGDRYSGEFVRELFRKQGITYELSKKATSELYLDLLPAINSGRVDLLDSDRLTNQLITLERRTSRTGRDLISHPPGSHDDLANAVAGALVAAGGSGGYDTSHSWVRGRGRPEASGEWNKAQLSMYVASGGIIGRR